MFLIDPQVFAKIFNISDKIREKIYEIYDYKGFMYIVLIYRRNI